MGLDHEVMPTVKDDSISSCGHAFGTGITITEKGVGFTVLVDFTGYALRVIKHNGSRVMTGMQYGYGILTHIVKQLENSHATNMVIMIDDMERTSKRKLETHEERDAAAANVDTHTAIMPYKIPTVVMDDGVSECSGGAIPMNMDRVVISRHMRRSLFDYLLLYLSLTLPTKMQENQQLLLDYCDGGPWWFKRGRRPVQMTHMRHMFGEPDMCAGLYTRYFNDHSSIYISTLDSDVIAIMLNYINVIGVQNCKHPIYIQRGHGEPLIDMRVLYKCMGTRIIAFLVMAVATGTDYHHKNTLWLGQTTKQLITWLFDRQNTYIINKFFSTWKGWNLLPLIKDIPGIYQPVFARPEFITSGESKQPIVPAAAATTTTSARKRKLDDAMELLMAKPVKQHKQEGQLTVMERLHEVVKDSAFYCVRTRKPRVLSAKTKAKAKERAAIAAAKAKAKGKAPPKPKAPKPPVPPKDKFTPEGAVTWAWNAYYWYGFNWNVIAIRNEDRDPIRFPVLDTPAAMASASIAPHAFRKLVLAATPNDDDDDTLSV